jgi:hypothetical protein
VSAAAITAGVTSAACKTAVDRANAMLGSAVRLREAMGEQGRILRDPASRRLSGPQALERVAPALRVGASESNRFDRALADYRQVVDRCKLQAPEPGRAGQRRMVAKTIRFDR